MRFLTYCFLLLTSTCCAGPAWAQARAIGLPYINNYERSDYNGGTQNWDIGEDSQHNLYFANNAGLLQFDGANWTKYSLPNHPSVRSLKVTAERIYVGGYNEFGYFAAGQKGALIYYSLIPLLPDGDKQQIDFVWKIHQYKSLVLFQCFKQIFIYNGRSLQRLEAPGRFQFSFLVGDELFLQDVTAGLLQYKGGNLTAVPQTALLNTTEVWGMSPLNQDSVLITTQKGSVFIFAGNNLRPWSTGAAAFLKKNGCLGQSVVNENLIAFRSVLDGVIISDRQGRIVQHINQKKGLQNNTVLSSYVDNSGNLWLGLDDGIDFVNHRSPLTFIGASQNISAVYASVIHDGNIYVATNRGLFHRSWTTEYTDEPFALVEGTTGQAWNVQQIDGRLICAHNSGLLIVAGDKVIKRLDDKGYWGVKPVPGDAAHSIAAHYNGFTLLEKSIDEWKVKAYLDGLDKTTRVFDVTGGHVWMHKDDQLHQAKLSSDLSRFERIQVHNQIAPGIRGGIHIHSIRGRTYFEAANRFYLFSSRNAAFEEDKNLSNLFGPLPGIRYCFEDAAGNLWYIYNETVGMLKRKAGGGYVNISSPLPGLGNNLMVDYPSVFAHDPQNVFIGLTNGLSHFNPDLVTEKAAMPVAHIRSLLFAGDTVLFGNVGNKGIAGYSLDYKNNNVRFGFSSPSYESPRSVEFSYRLQGFDEDWSGWTPVTFKEYTNLREGPYTMQVRARNGSEIVSEPATVSFTVAPPFYRHPLAYLLYLIVVAMAAYFIRQRIRLKIRKNRYYQMIEQRKLYLEREAKIKAEQEALEKEIERLKVEQLRTTILARDKELVNNSFQVVRKNKMLNGIIQSIKGIDTESLNESARAQLNKLNKNISKELDSDRNWEELEKHIRNVHFDFLKRLKERYPTISPRELDLATYLLLNMSSKEVAEIMNISAAGVELARYRLRKKMGLQRNENLVSLLMSV